MNETPQAKTKLTHYPPVLDNVCYVNLRRYDDCCTVKARVVVQGDVPYEGWLGSVDYDAQKVGCFRSDDAR